MKDILIKLRFIYLRYIIISIGFIILYSSVRWFLNYKLGVNLLKDDLLNFWFPFLLPMIPIIIWLRRRIWCLNIQERRDNGFFLYQIIAALTIFVPTYLAQEYLEASRTKLINVKSISEITNAKNIDCYIIEHFDIIREYAGAYKSCRTSGRHNEHLFFKNFFVVPMVDESNQLDINSHKYWYGIKFTKEMSNYAGDSKKNERGEAFYQACIENFEQNDFKNFVFLKGLNYSDDRDGYIEAIKARQNNVNTDGLIILEPIKEPFNVKLKSKFDWILASFGIGAFVFLLMILVPSLNMTELKRCKDKKPLREDDLKDTLKFLVPRSNHFTAALLIDINLLIFILMVASGINVISATPDELLKLGAIRRYELLNGEFWRLFTSMFLHVGLLHVFSNLIGIGITCSLIEPILGRLKTLIAYLFSGVSAGVVSIIWHENLISVGASGAIFGMMGIMIALLITKKASGFKSIFYVILVLFGVVSLLFGLLGGIDNAAHIGGLLAGIVIGLLFIILKWKEWPQDKKRYCRKR